MCLCEEHESNSERFFSLREAVADIKQNKSVLGTIGARFQLNKFASVIFGRLLCGKISFDNMETPRQELSIKILFCLITAWGVRVVKLI